MNEPDRKKLLEQLKPLFSRLTPQEVQILKARWGLTDGRSRTKEWIAAELGVRPEQVERLERLVIQNQLWRPEGYPDLLETIERWLREGGEPSDSGS